MKKLSDFATLKKDRTKDKNMIKNTVSFTKKAIEALPIPTTSGYTYYAHPSIPGLKVGVTKNGIKTFLIRKTINGKTETIILGTYNSKTFTPENAIKKSQEMFNLINSGINPNEKKHILSKDITVETLLEKYLGENEKTNGQKNKETTSRDKTYLLKKHLKSLFKRKVSSISQDDLRKLHKDISETAPTAANRTIAWISAMFTWAQNNGLFSGKNPVKKFSKRNPEKKRDRFLNTEELSRFMEQLEQIPLFYKTIFYILLFTGFRKSNVFSLKWEYIDFNLSLLSLPDTKNNRPQKKKIEPETRDLLLQLRNEQKENGTLCEWVFPSESKTGHIQDIKHFFNTLLKNANINNLHLHDLRRTFASYLAMNGASQFILSQALGHKDTRSVSVYAHLMQETVDIATEKGVSLMKSYASNKISQTT